MKLPNRDDPRTRRIVSAFVLAAVAVIAFVDSVVVTNLSLGFLYFLPVSLSALVHRLPISFALVLLCVFLRERFGPFEHSGWEMHVRNVIAFLVFSGVVVLLNVLVRQRTELSRLMRRQQERFDKEIAQAAESQQRLLYPSRLPSAKNWDVAVKASLATVVGGTFYDFLELDSGRLAVVIADVSGKGLEATSLLPTVQASVRMFVYRSLGPEEVLKRLNDLFYDLTEEQRHVALFLVKHDPASKQMEFANGGHQPPLFLKAGSGEVRWLVEGGPVVGLLPQAEFQSERVDVGAGDVLILYSKGLAEAANPDGEHYSRERLAAVASKHAGDTAEQIASAIDESVTEFRGAATIEDDSILVIVRVRGVDSVPS